MVAEYQAAPFLERECYLYSGDAEAKLKMVHVCYENLGIHHPPAPCCGSTRTTRKLSNYETSLSILTVRPCLLVKVSSQSCRLQTSVRMETLGHVDMTSDLPSLLCLLCAQAVGVNVRRDSYLERGRASSIYEYRRSGIRLVHTGSAHPVLLVDAIYRIIAHNPGCAHNSDLYFDASDALTVSRLPPLLRSKLPVEVSCLATEGSCLSRAAMRNVTEDMLRGGEGAATIAGVAQNAFHSSQGEATMIYLSQLFQWRSALAYAVLHEPTSQYVDFLRRKLWRWLLNLETYGMAKLVLVALGRPDSSAPEASALRANLENVIKIDTPMLRRELQSAASMIPTRGKAITGDHCFPIGTAIALPGPVDEQRMRTCYQLVDCSTGLILSGVLVPGTRLALLEPAFAAVGRDTAYETMCIDNAGSGDEFYKKHLGVERISQGLGHLLRRAHGTFNRGSDDYGAACRDLGLVFTAMCPVTDEGIKSALLTPGGIRCGSKIQTAASTTVRDAHGDMVRRAAVIKTFGAGDCISAATLASMIADGSFQSTMSAERKPMRREMAAKKLHFQSFLDFYFPNGMPRMPPNRIPVFSADTIGTLITLKTVMVKYTDGIYDIAESNGAVGPRGLKVYHNVESENGGERAHYSLERGLPNAGYTADLGNFICHAEATRHNHLLHNKLLRSNGVADEELRLFHSKPIAVGANEYCDVLTVPRAYIHEHRLKRDSGDRYYGDYWRETLQIGPPVVEHVEGAQSTRANRADRRLRAAMAIADVSQV